VLLWIQRMLAHEPTDFLGVQGLSVILCVRPY
jgi:hypothetical protein